MSHSKPCPHCGQAFHPQQYDPGTALIRLVESRDEEEYFIFTLVTDSSTGQVPQKN